MIMETYRENDHITTIFFLDDRRYGWSTWFNSRITFLTIDKKQKWWNLFKKPEIEETYILRTKLMLQRNDLRGSVDRFMKLMVLI